ncbi:adenylate/guanylate cyclase domain-containing protein [Stappia stellulata]|uniref:adenylate/guanylate cyclase domain-containing protein n=1 Tax=Stappia stellulata TaxID=71235 RepID=UPI000429406C|nr:adenylate/guanylate cyclase domain-containing protein [Stappia stellulata]
MTRARIAITPSIFSITLVIALGLAGAIISYSHRQGSDNAEVAANALMDRALETIDLRISAHVEPIERSLRQATFWSALSTLPSVSGHPLRARMLSLLKDLPQASAVFVGFEGGDHYQIAAAAHRPPGFLADKGAPAETVFQESVILRNGRDFPISYARFLDANGVLLATRVEPGEPYDPRGRPWYRLAREGGGLVRTDTYRFSGTEKLGLTLAQGFPGGVVGMDVTLAELTAFLNAVPQAEDGIVALFHDDGTILAHSGVEQRNGAKNAMTQEQRREKLELLVKRLAGDPLLRATSVNVSGQTWLVRRNPVDLGGGAAENLVVAMPRSAVVGPIEAASRRTLVVSLLIVLLSIPLIWLVARRISRPVQELGEAAERIGRFELEREIAAGSIIREIDVLQRAMERMRHSLSMFSLYAPKALVRQLVASDTPPALGGERRDVTVFFMDLENFTAMSSHLEPEEVMLRMSQYFERVTEILHAHGATIDKYIGDAVMAFWNAPMTSKDHPAKACAAALAVIAETSAMTSAWTGTGAPAVRTRIGIHSGQAIIGNVGSSDRMNYTALGSTVNLASRLEGLNRDLGTSILVSADVVERVGGRFAFRSAGDTEIKGYGNPVPVFELLAVAPDAV